MPGVLIGKTALVTGGARRIGRSVALALADLGADVVIHYNRSGTEAMAVMAEAESRGVRSFALGADLSDPEAAEPFFARVVRTAGPVDILVNSASSFPENTLTDSTPADFLESFTVNALSPFLLCRALAAQEREGSVVNFLDARITDYDRRHAAYHVAKRAFHTMTMMSAAEFAPSVRVNAVAPGIILPPEGKDETYLEGLARTNPLGRIGTLEEVDRTVIYLITSGFITGQVIYLDGGRHMRGSMYGA